MDDQKMLMNPHERAILENFLDQLVRVRWTWKIREADAMIRRALHHQPDAAYLLVQRSLMVARALEKTKARLAKYELAQGRGYFFDAGAPSPTAPTPWTVVGASAPKRSQAFPPDPVSALPGLLPAVAAPAASEPLRVSGAASFLGQAAATAAGMAGGAFLVKGLENLIDDYVADHDYACLV
jgi:hypothetical protein